MAHAGEQLPLIGDLALDAIGHAIDGLADDTDFSGAPPVEPGASREIARADLVRDAHQLAERTNQAPGDQTRRRPERDPGGCEHEHERETAARRMVPADPHPADELAVLLDAGAQVRAAAARAEDLDRLFFGSFEHYVDVEFTRCPARQASRRYGSSQTAANSPPTKRSAAFTCRCQLKRPGPSRNEVSATTAPVTRIEIPNQTNSRR